MQKLFQILTSFSMYMCMYTCTQRQQQRQRQSQTHWSFGSKCEQIDEKCTEETRKNGKKTMEYTFNLFDMSKQIRMENEYKETRARTHKHTHTYMYIEREKRIKGNRIK